VMATYRYGLSKPFRSEVRRIIYENFVKIVHKIFTNERIIHENLFTPKLVKISKNIE